jgi:hypothetical protein
VRVAKGSVVESTFGVSLDAVTTSRKTRGADRHLGRRPSEGEFTLPGQREAERPHAPGPAGSGSAFAQRAEPPATSAEGLQRESSLSRASAKRKGPMPRGSRDQDLHSHNARSLPPSRPKAFRGRVHSPGPAGIEKAHAPGTAGSGSAIAQRAELDAFSAEGRPLCRSWHGKKAPHAPGPVGSGSAFAQRAELDASSAEGRPLCRSWHGKKAPHAPEPV